MVKKREKSKKPAGGRREAFLEAAVECVKKLGLVKTNSYAITKALGVSQPSFFYYFPDQETFYRELVLHIVKSNRDTVGSVELEKPEKTALGKIRQYVEGNLLWTERFPAHVDILLFGMGQGSTQPALQKIVAAALEAGQARLYALIAEGNLEKEFTPQMPARALAYLLHKALIGALIDFHSTRGGTAQRKTIVDSFMATLDKLLI